MPPGYSHMRITRYRLIPDTHEVEFVVESDENPGEETVITEFHLQENRPSLVYKHWSKEGGRCNATGYNKWHVFKIIDHRGEGNETHYRVQWVRYSLRQTTWESITDVWDYGKEYVREYHGDMNIALPEGFPDEDVDEDVMIMEQSGDESDDEAEASKKDNKSEETE